METSSGKAKKQNNIERNRALDKQALPKGPRNFLVQEIVRKPPSSIINTRSILWANCVS